MEKISLKSVGMGLGEQEALLPHSMLGPRCLEWDLAPSGRCPAHKYLLEENLEVWKKGRW